MIAKPIVYIRMKIRTAKNDTNQKQKSIEATPKT